MIDSFFVDEIHSSGVRIKILDGFADRQPIQPLATSNQWLDGPIGKDMGEVGERAQGGAGAQGGRGGAETN